MLKTDIKQTVVLSVPIVVGQLGQLMMSVTDSVMVGRVGTDALAAAALGNAVFMLIMIVGIGLSMAVTPLTAIAYGAGRHDECGIVLRQGLLVNTAAGIVFCLFTLFVSRFLHLMNQPLQIVGPATVYLRVLGCSMLPIMLFQNYRQFSEGVSILKPAMYINLLANIVNILANWIFIYGNLGMPALGLTGAGIATFSSRSFMAVCMILAVTRSSQMKPFDPSFRFRRIDFDMMARLLKVGLPMGIQYFFEVSAFAGASIIIGWMGAKELAAHQIALNLASISFMVVLGIAAAGTIRVGNAVGKQDVGAVRRAGFTASILCALFMACAAVIFISLKRYLPTLYVSDPEVIAITASLLIIVAVFQVSDGVQAAGLGILRGMTDMKIPTLITLAAYWVIGLPSGYLMAFKLKLGVYGVWYGLLLSLTASAVLMMMRFNSKSRDLGNTF
ncbi:MAG: MATE family efflux transporter [Desulfobacteraceae bacterium]|nr:MAG: MATE family efflux transporter [Desulfobacteraceae bacterium]